MPREWDRWTKIAVAVWGAIVLVVCIRGVVQPTSHTLYPTYARVGAEWLTRGIVYHDHWTAPFDQYRYSPLVTAFLAPLSVLPMSLGSVLWRLLNAGVFLGALAWWLRVAAPSLAVPLTARHRAILFLLAAPLALSSLSNGQPNPLVIGLLLAAMAASARERWTLAAFCIGLATALKMYPIAVGLLLAAVYPRRFALRLLLVLGFLAVLPFFLQNPDYVADQYVHWFARLGHNDRKFWPLEAAYRDLWLLCRVTHLPITPRAYLGIQLLTAAGCAVLCVAGRLRDLPRTHVLLMVFALGSCWMILCGPATESCTYVLLSPALAWAVLAASLQPGAAALRLLPRLAFGLLLGAVLAGAFPGTARVHALGFQPLGALLLSMSYEIVFVKLLTQPRVTRKETILNRAA